MLWLCTIHDDSEQFYEINELQIEIEYYIFFTNWIQLQAIHVLCNNRFLCLIAYPITTLVLLIFKNRLRARMQILVQDGHTQDIGHDNDNNDDGDISEHANDNTDSDDDIKSRRKIKLYDLITKKMRRLPANERVKVAQHIDINGLQNSSLVTLLNEEVIKMYNFLLSPVSSIIMQHKDYNSV